MRVSSAEGIIHFREGCSHSSLRCREDCIIYVPDSSDRGAASELCVCPCWHPLPQTHNHADGFLTKRPEWFSAPAKMSVARLP